MGFIPRRRIIENLKTFDVFVEDTQNEYFIVQDIPDTFVQGRSAFKIFGSQFLKKNVPLKIEILDKNGNTIYVQPVKYGQGISPKLPYRYISVEVYPPPFNVPGEAELVILGELDNERVPFNIPNQFVGTYNVRYRKKVNVDTATIINSQPILFYKKPTIAASATTIAQKKSDPPANAYISGSVVYGIVKKELKGVTFGTGSSVNLLEDSDEGGKSDTPSGDIKTETNLWKYKTGLYSKRAVLNRRGVTEERSSAELPQMTIFTIVAGSFNTKLVGGEIEINNIQLTGAEKITLSGLSMDASSGHGGGYPQDDINAMFTLPRYKARIESVISDKKLTTVKPYSVKFDGPETTSEGVKIYSDIASPLLSDNIYANYTASYVDWNVPATSSYRFDTFIDVDIKNMRTFSGDVYRLKVYGASDSSQGDFPVLLDTIVESPELLVDTDVASFPLRSGYLQSQAHIDKYWANYGGDNAAATLQPYYTMSLADAVYLSGSYDEFNSVGRFELRKPYEFTVKKDIPYTLSFNAYGKKTLKTINPGGDQKNYGKLMVHLSGSNIAGDSRLNITHKTTFGQSLTNATNQKVGLELKDDDPDTIVEFPRVSHTFYPKFKLDKIKNDDTILQFRIEAGDWYISDISLRPAQDTGFSPDEMKIRVPIGVNTLRPDNFDLLIEYYDINGNTAEAITFKDNIGISGSALVVEGNDNLLTGSLYIGGLQGEGIELAGANSAYMRSIGYEGFTSASIGEPGAGLSIGDNTGYGGFMIWSGSVLPDAPDDYKGAGLEIHDGTTGTNESFFKFRTNPSQFKVKTNNFFFGSASSGSINYVSGSNGNLEISSSNFELQRDGDVVMQGTITAEAGGTIGGFTIGSDSLTATNFVLNTTNKALSLGSGENIFIADADTGIQLGSATFDNAEFSVTPAGVLKAESGTIAGWSLSDASISKLTDSKYSGLSSTGDTRIFAGADNLTAGTASAPFNVKADGSVTASAGLIGGWSLTQNDLKSPNGRVSMSAYPGIERITVRKANMNELVRIGEISNTAGADPKYGIKIYDGTQINYGVSDDTHTDQIVLLGEQGNKIGGWEITSTQLRTIPNSGLGGTYDFNNGEEGIVMFSAATESAIHSAGFVSGLKGFKISSLGNGSAEFENATIRGTLRTTVFEKESVNVVGGQLMIANSTTIGCLKSGSFILAGAPSASATDVTMSVMNVSGFARGEILKAKKISDTGFAVEYLYVTGSKRFSEDPALAYLTASLGTASSGEHHPPLDPDGVAGELYVGRAYGDPNSARSSISSSITRISGSIELKTGGNDGSGVAFGAPDIIYVNNSGSIKIQDIIEIGQEKMKVTKVTGSLPVLGLGGLQTSASLNVVRDFNDTVPQVHNHGAQVLKYDTTGSLDVPFLKGLVSTAQTYNEGQVLVSTGKYTQGTDWRGRFDYRYNVSTVNAASKYKLTGASGLLTTSGKKDATSLQIHATDNDAESHHSLFGKFDKGSYIVLLVDGVKEWYRYRVTGNPSLSGTGATSIHTYPIKLNQDFYNAGSSLNTADRVVQFWFMSSIQDVSSGYILMNANPNDLYTPYMDIVERTGPDVYDLQLRTRLGDLSGLSSAYLYGDEEPGFGLYTENGYFAGSIHATTGSIHGVLHVATTQGGIETGEKISMGRNVYGSNDGIIFGTSGYNYWWTTGDFGVGSETKYLSFSNSEGTFKLKTDDVSIDTSTFMLSSSLNNGTLRMGASKGPAAVDANTAGIYMDGTGDFQIYGDADNYFRFDTPNLDIKAEIFDLDATTVVIDSATNSGKLSLGASPNTTGSGTAKGVYMDGTGDFLAYTNATNYIRKGQNKLDIKADTFDLDASTLELTSAASGRLSLGVSPPTSVGTTGIFLSGSGHFSIQEKSDAFMRLDDDGFQMTFPSFSVSPAGFMSATDGVFKGNVSATTGFIGSSTGSGWNIDGSTISDVNNVIQLDSSATSPNITITSASFVAELVPDFTPASTILNAGGNTYNATNLVDASWNGTDFSFTNTNGDRDDTDLSTGATSPVLELFGGFTGTGGGTASTHTTLGSITDVTLSGGNKAYNSTAIIRVSIAVDTPQHTNGSFLSGTTTIGGNITLRASSDNSVVATQALSGGHLVDYECVAATTRVNRNFSVAFTHTVVTNTTDYYFEIDDVTVRNNGITETYIIGSKTTSTEVAITEVASYFVAMAHQPSNKKTEMAPAGIQSVYLANATLENANTVADGGNAFVRISPEEPKTFEVLGTSFITGSLIVREHDPANADQTTIGSDITTTGHIETSEYVKAATGAANGYRFGTSGEMYYDGGIKWSSGNLSTLDMLLTTAGALHTLNDVVAFSTTVSDKQFKKNVIPIQNGLSIVKQLQGVEFDWDKEYAEKGHDIGFIAQDVQKIKGLESVVKKHYNIRTDDEALTVSYEKITTVLVEAIKEQQKQIDELKKKLEEL
jgi:hypothetical protein